MSGSTFDQVKQDEWQQITVEDVDYFSVISDIYGQYRANNPRIRGAAMRHGQIEELPLDLCISVECALERVGLTLRERTLFQCFAAHGIEAVNKCLPASVKRQLQESFKHIYYGFPKLVQAAFHARDVQKAAQAREAKRRTEHQAASATFILENSDPAVRNRANQSASYSEAEHNLGTLFAEAE
jgi:hypothetical protein